MADLFSRGFHCLFVPHHSLPPKPSRRLRISAPIPLARHWLRVIPHTHFPANSTSPTSSDTEDFDIISSTVRSDGSVVFRFGNASEIRDKVGELDPQKLAREDVLEDGNTGARTLLSEGVENLNTEVDHNSGEEIASSSNVVVGVVDKKLQHPVNERENVVIDSDSETTVINDSQKVGRNFKLKSVEDGQDGILSEDVAAEDNNVQSVSEEDSEKESFILNNDSATALINDSQEIDKTLKLDSVKDSQHAISSEDVAAEGNEVPSVLEEDTEKESFILDNDSATTLTNDSQEIDRTLKLDSVKDGQRGLLTEDVAAEGNDVLSVSEEHSEMESFVLDNDSMTTVINDSQEIERHLKLDSVKESQHGILSEDVAAEVNDVPDVSVEDSEKESFVLDNDSVATVINDSQEIERHLKLDSVKDGQHGILSEDVVAEVNDAPTVSEEDPEKESFVLDNDSVTTVIDDSQEIERHLKLDSVKDGQRGILSEDVASEGDVLSVSEEDSEVDSHKVVVSTVIPESGVFSDLNSGASGVVEDKEEADKGRNDIATNNLTCGADADLSELMPVSTNLEFEQFANDEETTQHIVDNSNDASKMGKSAVLHDLVPSSDSVNKIDMGNTKRSDYENPSSPTAPEIHSAETASHGEKTSRTELFLVTGAACLPHPSKTVNKPTTKDFQALTRREDAYFISCQNWLGVADGVGQWSYEGSNNGLYMRELMEKCQNIVSSYENISTIKPAEVLTRSAAETQSSGSSSVLVAYFDGQALHAANVGNTGFVIIRDSSIFKKSTPSFHEFGFPLQVVTGDDPSEIIEGYKIDLNDGDAIIIATNGLFDNLYEQEIATIISKSLQAGLKPQEMAELLAMTAQEVARSSSIRSPFADTAQAVGYVGYTGGKLDDATVIVSLVRTN